MAYGTIIPELTIDGKPAPYGVVNERKIRAGAGMMFALGFFAFLTMYYERNFWIAFFVVLIFWIDFILKVFWGPEKSIFGFLAGFLVKNQKPEYVGAIQKRFAWSIGLGMSSVVLGFIVYQLFLTSGCSMASSLGGSSCVIPFLFCGICLVFMWLESAVGFCVGCAIYAYLVKKGIMSSPEYAPVCPGGVCSTDSKE